MSRLRLFVFDGSDAIERTYSRFPVHVGRHPRNECQILDPRVSRFHALLDVRAGNLVVRDVESQNGTTIVDSPPRRLMRGGEVEAHGGQVALLVGGVRVQARFENDEPGELPEAFTNAAREAATAILAACPIPGDSEGLGGGLDDVHGLLGRLFEGLFQLRLSLEDVAATEPVGRRSESTAALLKWLNATSVAVRFLEHVFTQTFEREAVIATEIDDALDAVLRELAPERIEQATSDVCTAWPATRAVALWGRYRDRHRDLARRQAQRPSLLVGRSLAALSRAVAARASQEADERLGESGRRLRRRAEAFRTTSSESGECPPSSD